MQEQITELNSIIQKLETENKRLKAANMKHKREAANYEDLYRTTNRWLEDLGIGSDQLLEDLRRLLSGFLQRTRATDKNLDQKKLHEDIRYLLKTILNRLGEYEQNTPLSFLELYE